MVVSDRPLWQGFGDELGEYFVRTYDYAMLYENATDAEPMYEGPARILANG